MQYLVVIEKSQSNYGAYVPDLPGCVAVARTKAELMRLVREAVELHLDALQQEGKRIPEPTATTELVEVGEGR